MFKKITSLLFMFFVVCIISVNAQPIITSNFNPVVGTTAKVAFADTTGVTEGLAGANVTYDYTLAISPIAAPISYTYKTPASTPYGAQYANANLAYQSGSSYAYLKTTSSAMESVGVATSDIQLVYTNLQKVLTYPFTMGNTFTDYFEGSGTNSQNLTTYRKGTTTSTADGYGTLMLPSATFNNVLRVKTVQNFNDSFNILGDDFVTRNEIITYNFFIDNLQQQLLGISYTHIDSDLIGVQESKSVQYFPDVFTSVTTIKNNQAFKLYPNPAANNFSVEFENSNNASTVELADITGKTVYSGNYSAYEQRADINTAQLAQGVYVVRLYDGNTLKGVQKLTIAR